MALAKLACRFEKRVRIQKCYPQADSSSRLLYTGRGLSGEGKWLLGGDFGVSVFPGVQWKEVIRKHEILNEHCM